MHGEGAHLGLKMTHHELSQEGSRAEPEAEAVSWPGGSGASWRVVAGRVVAGYLTIKLYRKMACGVLGLVLQYLPRWDY